MNKFVKGAVAAAALATGIVGMTAPAQAQRWHGGDHHGWDRGHDWNRGGYGYYGRGWRGDNAGAAVAAGILGLGVGAAIASADQPYYGYGAGYYAPPPPPPVYYAPAPAYGYYGDYSYGYGW